MKGFYYYFTYPIRLLLKKRVEKYRKNLKEIEWRQKHLIPKSRRTGCTTRVMRSMFSDMGRSARYRNFIKKWSL